VRGLVARATVVVAVATLAISTGLAPATTAGAADDGLVVMTRNLYLGADVADALALMPDIAAAAQFMWDQVQETDFTARVPALAEEAAQARPAAIGLQEATTWVCTPDAQTAPTAVYDFTAQFLAATEAAGTPYVVAAAGGAEALSPGYAIEPIVGATVVTDPAAFQPLFGTDQASCGFRIADALVVRADLAGQVSAAGAVTYDTTTEVVPGVITVRRGYAWADLAVGSQPVRLVTTHLESVWEPGEVPAAVLQARELIADLADQSGPLVVMGDFNSDPRDPRPAGGANPGGQPEASAACPDRSCNAYWSMVDAGFTDAGPDPQDPRNYSWGAAADLAGPSPERVQAAIDMGNPVGFTDRLDYVFARGDVAVDSSMLIGDTWPEASDTWPCTSAGQAANTAAMAAALGDPTPSGGVCLPTDHAGIVADLTIAPAAANPEDSSSTALVWGALFAVAVVAVGGAIAVLVRRRA
jgi:endonuclease/exonuclease/phosphatase family metal-dependent hydrolase